MNSFPTTRAAGCLQLREIEALVSGHSTSEDVRKIEIHLEGCVSCQERLNARAASPAFWSETSQTLRHRSDAIVETTERSEVDIIQGISLAPSDDPEMLGRIGPYEICGVVGRGGMGIVLKGWDRSLDRYVAIKVLHPSFAHQSISRHRFAREARAAAGVVHDNVIPIYCVDEHEHLPYLVMPYIKGESLQRRIDRKAPLPLEEMLEIALQISRGLEAAHQQGLVHRDIKPSNILLPESVSRVVITDFGVATAVDEVSLTRSNSLVGTPSYMSPEQIRGQAVDGRSDLFSLGCTIYAMASGLPPFRSTSPYTVLRQITDEPHQCLTRLRPDLPSWFSRLVDRLLEKNPMRRFTKAEELTGYLEDCLSHLRQPETIGLPRPPKSRSILRHSLWFKVGLGLIFVTGLTILLIGRFSSVRPRDVLSAPTSKNHDAIEPDERAEQGDIERQLLLIESELNLLHKELNDVRNAP